MAFLLANRWAAELLGIIVLLGSFYAWLTVHDASERKQGETRCEQKVSETKAMFAQAQHTREAAYDEQTKAAQAAHDQQLADLRVSHDPIVVHDGAVCGNPVRHPAPAGSDHPASGPTESGRGEDHNLRPLVERFELQYERALADCRQVLADWPK
jgi:hypothetical protein